jgi:hypothetical protein
VEARFKTFMTRHKKNRLMMDAARRGCALAAERLGSFKPKWWFFCQSKGHWLFVVGVAMFVASRFSSK